MMLRVLYKIYFWLIAIPIFLAVTFLTAMTVIIGCLLGFGQIFAYYPGMIWSRIVCMLAICPVKVEGRENILKGKSCVFVSNHQGAFDIFLIFGHLGAPIQWMMKKGLAKIPFVGWACRAAGFIFVDASSARKAQQSVADAERNLMDGYSLIIFPEGGRSIDGHIQRFKKGAFQIAVDLQLPLIPITLNGPYNVMPSGTLNINPHRIEMTIHPPIFPPAKEDYNKEHLQELVNITHQTIHHALWNEYK